MKKVLIIEDNPDIRENVTELLEIEGFDVKTAENGQRGLEAAVAFRPHVIVCDIMMPLLNGYELLELRKNNELLAEIPVIILSAQTENKDLKKALELGAYAYVRKPFESEELLSILKNALQISSE